MCANHLAMQYVRLVVITQIGLDPSQQVPEMIGISSSRVLQEIILTQYVVMGRGAHAE